MNKNVRVAKELIKLAKQLTGLNNWEKLDMFIPRKNNTQDNSQSSFKTRDVFKKQYEKFDKYVEKFCKLFDKNIKQKSNPEFAKQIAFDTKQVWKQISDFQDRERIERISGIEFNIIGEYVNAKDESITIPPMSLIMQYSLTVEQDSVLITPQIKLGETSLSQSGWGNIITTNAENTFTELKNAFDAGLVKLQGEMLNKFNPANGDKRIAKHSNRLLIANIITAIAETMEEMED